MSDVETVKVRNVIPLPGGSYEFADLEKALDKAVAAEPTEKNPDPIGAALKEHQKIEGYNDRDGLAVPPGHELKEVLDAQGNKALAPVPIVKKGEAVDVPEPTVTQAQHGTVVGTGKDATATK